eukprot:m.20431 g.20431  ORF g.20431 m.20431 type:complete len:438 (+) comp10548_c0_seq2:79-1392(+)
MGSSNSVHVQTSKPTYFAGDVVTGTIYLNCIQNFNCSGLHLALLGQEEARWVEQRSRTHHNADGSTRTETYDEPHHEVSTFFEVDVAVHNFGGSVMPGQYSFPFQFTLPTSLPGSFDCRSHHRSHGQVFYTAKAECKVAGMFSSNLRHSQPITVQALLNQNISPIIAKQHKDVNCCCCFNRGSADIAVHVEKNAYAPGEVANVICEVANNSTEDITVISVQLVRAMTLRAHGRTFTASDVVSQNSYPGVPKQTSRDHSNPLRLPLQLANQLAASVTSRLVNCTYTVSVVFETGGCCIGNLSVSVPVKIYAPQPQIEQWFTEAPAFWNNPQQFPLTQVNIPPPAYNALPAPPGVVNQQPGTEFTPAMEQRSYPPPPQQGYPPSQQQQGYPGYPPSQQGYPPPQQQQGYPPATYASAPPPSYAGQPSAPSDDEKKGLLE